MSPKRALKAVVPKSIQRRARALIRFLKSRQYAGGRLRCPICAENFSQFFPVGADVPILRELEVIGAGARAGAVCPRCESKERDRLIHLYLHAKADWVFRRPISLLHFAPEPALEMRLRAARNISYASADLHSPAADLRMDVTAIAQADASYDVIIANHVLEHVEDDAKAMGELFRILKRGGLAILQVPISLKLERTREDFSLRSEAERERAFGQGDHVRIYGRDYPTRLERAGFSVEAVAPAAWLDEARIKQFGLLAEERLFVCRKM